MATSDEDAKILKEVKDRLQKSIDDDRENRLKAVEDLEFLAVEGKQWPDSIRAARESEDRPCLTINKLPTFVDQVVGDQRMNRPSIKVLPVDSKADPKTATILSGWIRHVQNISTSDVAIDHAFEHAVACAYGAFRVITKYTSDSSFEQEAYIEKIDNALGVYWGKHQEYNCSDAAYCILITDLDKEEYKEKYGRDGVSFSYGEGLGSGWVTKDTVRLAEYFVKEPTEKTIYLLPDGRVIDSPTNEEKLIALKERKVKTYKIMWYLLSGDAVLDRREWVGKKYIPVIPVWGRELNVNGKRVLRGLVRNAKDPQRMYNYWESTDTEVVTLQPRVPYLVTPKQIDGHEDMWKNAQKKNYPYLLVNFDDRAPGWPHREAPPQASSAMVQKIAMADQEIRDTTGLQKASLGMASNERSGAAIRERKLEGDVGTFSYVDNLSRSIEHLGRVLVDIAPGLLDTERQIRLGFDDGTFGFEGVNVEDENGNILNDLSVGTYDVVVVVGPSFTTQRTEARKSISEFIQYYPAAAPLIGDLLAKYSDWPGAEEFAQRLELLLPPEVRAMKAAEAAKKAGVQTLPPVSAPAPPNPQQEIELQQEQAKLQKLQLEVAQEQERLKGLQLDNELKEASSKENIRKLITEIADEETTMGDSDAGTE